MNVENLILHINELKEITNEQWMNSLDDRKREELEFHNLDRDVSRVSETKENDTYEKFYGNRKYYQATKRSNEYVERYIKQNAKDKIFLDYACGNGGNAIKAASAGATLSLGLDISSVSVENASKVATEAKLDNVIFFQADAENTKLPDNCVDCVICSGMLHHLDLSYAFPELRRILKPGGKILAVEALDYNPIIKLYRMMTPDMRTDWEKAHILSLKDINFAKRFFTIGEIRFWHVIGYVGGKFPFLLPVLDTIDVLLEKIPFVQRLSWIFTFELNKN